MLRDLRKIWSIFTPAEKRRSVWMLVMVILMALAETGGVLSIMPFLAVLGRPDVIHQNHWLQWMFNAGHFDTDRAFMVALGLASIATVLVASVYKTITLHLINRFIYLLRHTVSARLLARYLRQPYEFFLQHNSAVLSRNVLNEVDQLLFSLIQPLSQLIAQGAVVLAMLALIFLYKPVVALVVVIVVGLLYGAIYGAVRRRLARIGAERQTADDARYKICSEVLGGIKDVKVTDAAGAYQQAFNATSLLFSRHMATSETLAQSPLYMVEAVGYTGIIALALVLMLQRGDIAHVLPTLGLFGFAAYRLLPSAQIMYRGFAKLRFSSAALDAVYHDLHLAEPPSVTGDPTDLTPRHAICLTGVTYAYPSTPNKPVLDHFDLTIPAGTSIGITGATGAGKSTLMDILLGLLSPQSGTLSVDGTAISAGNAGAWQRAIGYVPQHIYLADASVKANIAFGVPPGAIDMAAVERAARAAQIHDFVSQELEHGYDTLLGDRGIRLSGGQRQRIGIARALYRDPPVLLMDEATSALDNKTEEAVTAAIVALSGKKTIVIIAHRHASLSGCDRSIVLDKATTHDTE